MDKREVLEILKSVYDPDYLDKSIVDMGLVDEESIRIEGDTITVQYRITAPMCPYSAAIGLLIKYALERSLATEVEVEIEPGHFQEQVVNEVLRSEEKSRELFEKLRAYGVLEQCLRL